MPWLFIYSAMSIPIFYAAGMLYGKNSNFSQIEFWRFMLRAKGAGLLFFWTEFFVTVVLLGLSWLGNAYFGLPGFGMAFFGMNLLYGLLIFTIVRKCYSFYFSPENIQVFAMFVLATGIVFMTPFFMTEMVCIILNTCITIAVGIRSLLMLYNKTDSWTPAFLLKFKARFGVE